MEYFSDKGKQFIKDYVDNCKGDIEKAAKDLGLSTSKIKWAIKTLHEKNLESYAIGKLPRASRQMWDNKDPKISKAREQYEAGEVEIVSGYTEDTVTLYAIPRKVKDTKRRPYFSLILKEYE